MGLLSDLTELLLGLNQLLLIGPLRAIMHILQKGIENLSIELVPAPSLLRASGAWGTVVLGLQLGVRLLQGLEGGARLPSQLQHTGRFVMARPAQSKLKHKRQHQQQSCHEVRVAPSAQVHTSGA